MCKTKADNRWIQFVCFTAVITLSLPLHAQQTQPDRQSDKNGEAEIFSGPQPGEKLPPLKVRIVIGDYAGKVKDIIADTTGKTVFLVFMNEFGELENEMMRTITLYAEQLSNPNVVTAVVWLTPDPSDMETKLNRSGRYMPHKTPVGISLAGPEGPGAYGLNRNVKMTIVVAKDNVVTASIALIQPSIASDSLPAVRELVKVIGGKLPTYEEVVSPREQQFVAMRLERLLDKSTSDDLFKRMSRGLESYARSRPAAKSKLGQLASEYVQSDQYEDRKVAIGYLRKWAKEYGMTEE